VGLSRSWDSLCVQDYDVSLEEKLLAEIEADRKAREAAKKGLGNVAKAKKPAKKGTGG
jgi:hypothetical protein